MSATEYRYTLRDLELHALRRVGANRVHFALVMPDAIHDATIFGAPCRVTAGPVSAFCSRTLRGDMVLIPDDYLPGWRKNKHVCRECELVARLALEKAKP